MDFNNSPFGREIQDPRFSQLGDPTQFIPPNILSAMQSNQNPELIKQQLNQHAEMLENMAQSMRADQKLSQLKQENKALREELTRLQSFQSRTDSVSPQFKHELLSLKEDVAWALSQEEDAKHQLFLAQELIGKLESDLGRTQERPKKKEPVNIEVVRNLEMKLEDLQRDKAKLTRSLEKATPARKDEILQEISIADSGIQTLISKINKLSYD